MHPDVRIEVRDFGPLAHAAVDLRPLTVFLGPSNAGKTYLATLISALHRASSGFARIPPRGIFITERLNRMDSRTLEPAIAQTRKKLLVPGRAFTCSDLPKEVKAGFRDILDSLLVDVVDDLERSFDVGDCSELIRSTASDRQLRVSLRLREGHQDLWRLAVDVPVPSRPEGSGEIGDVVLVPANTDAKERRNLAASNRREPAVLFEWLVDRAARDGREPRVRHLPAARSGVLQSHQIIASSLLERLDRHALRHAPDLPTLPRATIDFMRWLTAYDEGKTRSQEIRGLADELERDPLDGQILALRPVPAGSPKFVYRQRGTTEDIRLIRASSMVTELTPVVLLLRGGLEPGDTLIIDEIEAHLHPAAQTQMATLLARLVRAGVRVLITTHSDWLLKELGNLMREGELADQTANTRGNHWLTPTEVGVWLFHTKESASGFTVKEIPFNPIEGIEPEEYETVAETLYNRSADLQNRRQEAASENGTERGD